MGSIDIGLVFVFEVKKGEKSEFLHQIVNKLERNEKSE